MLFHDIMEDVLELDDDVFDCAIDNGLEVLEEDEDEEHPCTRR